MIKKCVHNCESKFQDEKYGHGNRVMNARTNGNSPRCTNCGKDQPTGPVKKGK